MSDATIVAVHGRRVWDSRGRPTVEAEVRLAFPVSNRVLDVRASVIHVETVDTTHGPVHAHGVRFVDLPVEERDAIEMHCMQAALPVWRKRYRQTLDLFARTNEWVHNARGRRRRSVQLAAQVRADEPGQDQALVGGLLEEISDSGARLLLERPLTPGSTVHFEVPGTALRGTGQVVFTTAIETPMSVRFSVGVSLNGGRGVPARRGFPLWWTRGGGTRAPAVEAGS